MIHTKTALRGMVTAPHHLAAQAGLDILKRGGRAMEAAVATAAALAVVYPHMNSIGGDSFWIVREPDGSVHGVSACGAAAQAATLDLYKGLTAVPWRGPLAANTVAGTLSGWEAVLSRVAAPLSLEALLEPAIHYAEHGVVVTRGGAEIAATKDAELKEQCGYGAVFRPDDQPLKEGAVLKQPALAATLKALAAKGLRDAYEGDLARAIAADLAAAGSPVGAEDLRAHRAATPVPLTTAIRGVHLYNMTPPTQGFASLLILALYDRLGIEGHDHFDHLHGLIEATKQAFILRDRHIGDPAYMDFDAQGLLSDAAALDALARKIDREQALPWPHLPQQGDTVWFGAVDAEGRAVSAIQSTYFEFGSGIVLPQTGIIWQNRGASFKLAETGWNALKPGRKPFHTLNPALAVFDDGRVMSYGTMGGEGQPQTQAAVFSRYNAGMPLQQAITAPRWLLGKTWGEDSVSLKLEGRFDAAVIDRLKKAGHQTEIVADFTSMMGHAGALVRHADGRIEGAIDPRSDGGVAAW
ncbi:gamma-glutamyltransferase family protein [Asticcacaulis sp. AND118]|uniref:gamma-glutamyltransferase family protein n=1 Tax=Asticcacaulis sp. AND118 TaxID=2840468 RepID=UPI001CFFAEC9|nr:gamma-glutamyltransferase [Asticcacaulis sp. AND118]UDF04926.1 gamma-glutamyltransferase [Asticcacaulis sp. AND118]